MATILVVDDSQTIRKAIRSVLEQEGHSIVEAEDGIDGLAKFKDNGIQLIITDVNMPNMDGITMCTELKKTDKGKRIPVLIISTEGSPDLKTKAKTAGVLAWMTKPPQPEKIKETVKVVLSKVS